MGLILLIYFWTFMLDDITRDSWSFPKFYWSSHQGKVLAVFATSYSMKEDRRKQKPFVDTFNYVLSFAFSCVTALFSYPLIMYLIEISRSHLNKQSCFPPPYSVSLHWKFINLPRLRLYLTIDSFKHSRTRIDIHIFCQDFSTSTCKWRTMNFDSFHHIWLSICTHIRYASAISGKTIP